MYRQHLTRSLAAFLAFPISQSLSEKESRRDGGSTRPQLQPRCMLFLTGLISRLFASYSQQ